MIKRLPVLLYLVLISTNLFSQKLLKIREIDSIHNEFKEIFESYSEAIKNEYKNVVFVQIGSSEEGLELKKFDLRNRIPTGMSLSLNLVSSIEGASEMFERGSIYDQDIIGYVNQGPIKFIIYSRHEIEVSLSDNISRLEFDEFDLRGPPIETWNLLNYRGYFYKRVEF